MVLTAPQTVNIVNAYGRHKKRFDLITKTIDIMKIQKKVRIQQLGGKHSLPIPLYQRKIDSTRTLKTPSIKRCYDLVRGGENV